MKHIKDWRLFIQLLWNNCHQTTEAGKCVAVGPSQINCVHHSWQQQRLQRNMLELIHLQENHLKTPNYLFCHQ